MQRFMLATEEVTEAVTETAEKFFKPGQFVDTLPMMVGGMLGIFLVTGIIIGCVYLLGLIKNKGAK